MSEYKTFPVEKVSLVDEIDKSITELTPFEIHDEEYEDEITSFLSSIEIYTSALTVDSLKHLVTILRDPKVIRFALGQISRPFVKRVVILFANEHCEPSLRKILVEILANFAFEFPGFSVVWREILDQTGCQSATRALINHIDKLKKDTSRLQELRHCLLIIFNMTADDAHIFSIENVLKYGNWMLCSRGNDTLLNMFTFYGINMFRYVDLDDEDVFEILIEIMTKLLVLCPKMKDDVRLNLCWCLYFWIRRFSNLVVPVLNYPIGPWLLHNMYECNEKISTVSASILATASYLQDYEVSSLLREYVPLDQIVNVLNRHDKTLVYVVIFLYNYGLHGPDFVKSLILEDVVLTANMAFPEAPFQAKIEIMRLLLMLLEKAPDELLEYVMTIETIYAMNEVMLWDESPIVLGTLEGILSFARYNLPLLKRYLDLDNVIEYLDTDYGEIAQRIVEMFKK